MKLGRRASSYIEMPEEALMFEKGLLDVTAAHLLLKVNGTFCTPSRSIRVFWGEGFLNKIEKITNRVPTYFNLSRLEDLETHIDIKYQFGCGSKLNHQELDRRF